MDIERIAIVLHNAVLQKLQSEARIPEVLTQVQVQASYDRVYDILQESMNGKDLRTSKVEIQKEATLRSIQEIPIAIRDVTQEQNQTLPPAEDTSQDQPSDIQNLVEQELQKRGIQDRAIGAVPSPPEHENTPTPTPAIGSEYENTRTYTSTEMNTRNDHEFPPDQEGAARQPPLVRQETPRPPISPPPPDSFEPITTLMTSPQKGTEELRWEFTTESPLLGCTHVRIPHILVRTYPYLLLTLVNDSTTITHPIVHAQSDWYKVLHGKRSFGRLTGTFRVIITDPNGDVIRTKYPLRDVESYYHNPTNSHVIDPATGIAYSLHELIERTQKDESADVKPSEDETSEEDASDKTDDGDNESKEPDTEEPKTFTLDDDVILSYDDHSFVVFFTTSAA